LPKIIEGKTLYSVGYIQFLTKGCDKILMSYKKENKENHI